MEKLQPLITHRFWVLFGLALLVPFISWWLYNSSMAEAIEGRQSIIDSEFQKAGQGGDAPNENWIAGGKKYNEMNRNAYDEAARKLWLDQQNGSSMFWPKRMLPYVKDLTFGQSFDGPDSTGGLTIYKTEYDRQHEKDVLPQIDTYEDGEGLCEVNTNMIHRAGSWSGLPTWEQVWNAQEDEWVVAQLLRSINKVNKDAAVRSITQAPVRQLHELLLYGGNLDEDESKKKKKRSGGGVGSFAGRDIVGMGGGGTGMGGESSSIGGMGGGGSAKPKVTISSPELDFDVIEEFGSPEDTSAKPKKKERSPGGSFSQGSSPSDGPQRRYVHNQEDGKFKTRGFKTRLTIEQDKLPVVLAELTNSPWPVEIVRVHWQASNESDRRAQPVAGTGGFSSSGLGGDETSQGGQQLSGFGGFGGGNSGSAGESSSTGSISKRKTQDDGEIDPLDAALQDPTLATVVIAGWVTIFRASEEEAAKMKEMMNEKAAADGSEPGSSTKQMDAKGDEMKSKEGMSSKEEMKDDKMVAKEEMKDGETEMADKEEPASDGKKSESETNK